MHLLQLAGLLLLSLFVVTVVVPFQKAPRARPHRQLMAASLLLFCVVASTTRLIALTSAVVSPTAPAVSAR
jgi:hypothetical protein